MSLKSRVETKGDSAAVELPRPFSSVWRAGTELSITPLGADAALLLRAGLRGDGFIAGSLESLSAAELFGLLVSGFRSGTLIYSRESVRKSVHFDGGEVVFASSTEPWERLGPTLVRMGLIDREQLHAALTEVGPGARLGQVLTRSGRLSAAKLYTAMTQVIREIVLGLFAEKGGNLLFLENTPPPEDALKLAVSTRELVLLGIQQSGEVRGVLAVQPPAPPVTSPSDTSGVERPALERFDMLLRTICEALGSTGNDLDPLRSFLSDPLPGMEEAFAGVTLSDDGSLDVDRLLENLGETRDSEPGKVWEALDAFASYALFSARNVLPPDAAEALSMAFRRIQEGRHDRR